MSNPAHHGFSIIGRGTIFRTAEALQGYYPRVLCLSGSEWLASFIASKTCESPDSHPELARSLDAGKTWVCEGPLDPAAFARGRTAEMAFLSKVPDGSLFCLGPQWTYDGDDGPLIHPETLGMRDNRILLRKSGDHGRTWTAPVEIPKPYPVPLEVPTGLTALSDGALLLSCATWGCWDGSRPFGNRVTTLRSTNGGSSWEGPIDIFFDPAGRNGFWEARIAQLSKDTLLATCWAHDWQSDCDLPNHFALSQDAGRSWETAAPSPVMGQTGWPLPLGEHRILFVYNHRRAPVGVRAQIAEISDGRWKTLHDGEVWTPEDRRTGEIVRGDYAVTHFQFGAPSAVRLDPERILVVYWSVTGGRAGIDWTMIRLNQ